MWTKLLLGLLLTVAMLVAIGAPAVPRTTITEPDLDRPILRAPGVVGQPPGGFGSQAPTDRKLSITGHESAPVTLTEALTKGQGWLRARIDIDENLFEQPLGNKVSVSIRGNVADLVITQATPDPKFGLTHLVAVDPAEASNWILLTRDQEGNLAGTGEFANERIRLTSVGGTQVLAEQVSGKVKRDGQDGPPLERRHVQMVELSLRGVGRYSVLDRTAELSAVQGGDLGVLKKPEDAQSYLRSMDALLGNSAGVSVRVERTELTPEVNRYYVRQYIDNIPRRGGRVLIKADSATGKVLSITGSISDFELSTSGLRIATAEVAARLATSTIQHKAPGLTLMHVEAPDKPWRITQDGPEIFWEGTVGAEEDRTSRFTYQINARTGEIQYGPTARHATRVFTCSANGSASVLAGSGSGGSNPWGV